MKKIAFIFSFLLLSSFVGAQNGSKQKADKLFDKKAYVEAAAIYKALEPTKDILQNLGDCYYFNSEMESAVKAYTQLFSKYKDNLDKEVYFRFGHALMGIKDYERSDQIMTEYLGTAVNTNKFIDRLSKVLPYEYELKRMSNSASTGDFGITFYGEKVVFASLRNKEGKQYHWNNQPYLDLFEATVTEEYVLENIKPFSEEINTKTHESNATFSSDGKTMYFSRTNIKRVKIEDKKVATVKIFKAQYIDSIWTNVEEVPFSSDLYSTQHPVLNKENTRLYFASDMPGSVGSFDIYYVDILEEGYGEPVNLGSVVNTKHREQFPFIAPDSTLYFASDGHQGFGGLDVFMTRSTEGVYIAPLNLGGTLNSSKDDFGYILKEEDQKGYVSSNREGLDNLYCVKRKESDVEYLVEGKVIDKTTKELLPETLVTLYDEDGNLIGEMTVGEDATYSFNVSPNKTYKIEGKRDFYVPSTQEFTTNELGKTEYDIELEIVSYDVAEEVVVTREDGRQYVELENIYFDLDKWDIKPQAAQQLDLLVELMQKYPDMQVQLGAHTDSRSSSMYNLRLSQNRADAALEYLVSKGIAQDRLEPIGFGEEIQLVKCGENCTELEHSINRRVEFVIIK